VGLLCVGKFRSRRQNFAQMAKLVLAKLLIFSYFLLALDLHIGQARTLAISVGHVCLVGTVPVERSFLNEL
jgi:hypothetical protein